MEFEYDDNLLSSTTDLTSSETQSKSIHLNFQFGFNLLFIYLIIYMYIFWNIPIINDEIRNIGGDFFSEMSMSC